VVLPALGAALDGWDDARRRAFFAHLSALDRLVRSGEEVSEAVLLGALLIHVGQDAEALLASLVSSSRLPRKIAERAKLALHAQRVSRDPQRRRRRRGGGQPHHADALQLLRISVEATGEGRELLERLTAARGHGPAPEGEPARHGRDGHGHAHAQSPGPRHATEVEVETAETAEADLEGPGEGPGEGEGDADGIRTVTVSGAPAAGAEGAGSRRRRRRRGGRRRRRRAGAGAPPAGS
jgi:poly(A) polymerase